MAFFTLVSIGGIRGLQVQVSAYFFHWFDDFPSFTPLMLSPYIYSILELAHPKQQAENFQNRG
jgi:hypothetical protein